MNFRPKNTEKTQNEIFEVSTKTGSELSIRKKDGNPSSSGPSYSMPHVRTIQTDATEGELTQTNSSSTSPSEWFTVAFLLRTGRRSIHLNTSVSRNTSASFIVTHVLFD